MGRAAAAAIVAPPQRLEVKGSQTAGPSSFHKRVCTSLSTLLWNLLLGNLPHRKAQITYLVVGAPQMAE